jgi:sulfate transport system substrate-binding protein
VVTFSPFRPGRVAGAFALIALAALPLALMSQTRQSKPVKDPQKILLVSYAVTKAAFDKILPAFAAEWKKKTGQTVTVKASYGGSGSQTRAVIDGLEADVVALALEGDVLKLQEAGLVQPGWEKELPNESIITNSVVAFFVRQGNPKKINTWNDLDNPNVDVVTANPKTSGGARWNFLGIWGSVTETGGSEDKARKFVTTVYKNVDVLPKDAREANDTFIKKDQGDVLLNYENEAILAKKTGQWSVPYKIPSPNILIEGPVTVVDRNVDKKGTRKVAEALTQFLYTPQAQRVFADSGFRPVNPAVKAATARSFPAVKTFTVADFGGWKTINKKVFGNGGLWDQIFSQSR